MTTLLHNAGCPMHKVSLGVYGCGTNVVSKPKHKLHCERYQPPPSRSLRGVHAREGGNKQERKSKAQLRTKLKRNTLLGRVGRARSKRVQNRKRNKEAKKGNKGESKASRGHSQDGGPLPLGLPTLMLHPRRHSCIRLVAPCTQSSLSASLDDVVDSLRNAIGFIAAANTLTGGSEGAQSCRGRARSASPLRWCFG